MLDGKVWEGVTSLLDQYLEIKPEDFVIVAYARDSFEAAAWVSVALEMRGIRCEKIWFVPLQDDDFGERLKGILPNPTGLMGRLVMVTFEHQTLSHDNIIREELKDFAPEKTVIFRAISTCANLFSDCLRVSPEELSARNTTILDRCMGTKILNLTTDGGTDLSVRVDSKKYRWISNRGVWRPESFIILPAGEVATYPDLIEGVFVADFAFNLNVVTDLDVRLNRHPVTVWLEDSRAVKYRCKNKAVMKFLDECFADPCARRVGELGFGTNFGVEEPVSLNSHINERHTGIHLGFGESNQPPSVVGYTCDIHLDLIAKGGTIAFEGKNAPIDLQNVKPSPLPHPTRTLDEDANSPDGLTEKGYDDCCGIRTPKGMKLWRDRYSEGKSRP